MPVAGRLVVIDAVHGQQMMTVDTREVSRSVSDANRCMRRHTSPDELSTSGTAGQALHQVWIHETSRIHIYSTLTRINTDELTLPVSGFLAGSVFKYKVLPSIRN